MMIEDDDEREMMDAMFMSEHNIHDYSPRCFCVRCSSHERMMAKELGSMFPRVNYENKRSAQER